MPRSFAKSIRPSGKINRRRHAVAVVDCFLVAINGRATIKFLVWPPSPAP
jgi:hypothetical protein